MHRSWPKTKGIVLTKATTVRIRRKRCGMVPHKRGTWAVQKPLKPWKRAKTRRKTPTDSTVSPIDRHQLKVAPTAMGKSLWSASYRSRAQIPGRSSCRVGSSRTPTPTCSEARWKSWPQPTALSWRENAMKKQHCIQTRWTTPSGRESATLSPTQRSRTTWTCKQIRAAHQTTQ